MLFILHKYARDVNLDGSFFKENAKFATKKAPACFTWNRPLYKNDFDIATMMVYNIKKVKKAGQ